jgi:hypothetical protein
MATTQRPRDYRRRGYQGHAVAWLVLFLAIIAVLAIVAGYLPHAAGR